MDATSWWKCDTSLQMFYSLWSNQFNQKEIFHYDNKNVISKLAWNINHLYEVNYLSLNWTDPYGLALPSLFLLTNPYISFAKKQKFFYASCHHHIQVPYCFSIASLIASQLGVCVHHCTNTTLYRLSINTTQSSASFWREHHLEMSHSTIRCLLSP